MLILKLVLLGALGAADAPLLLRQALADLQAGRLEPAEQKLSLVVRQQPDSAAAHHYLGVARFRLRRLPTARQALEQAVRLDPSRAGAWKALGAVHASENNFHLADEPFRKACALDPREEEACYYLGRNYYELSQFEPAIAAYEKALPLDALPWRVHNGLAQALAALGRAPEAERRFRLAVETYRDRARRDESPRIDLGVFLFRQGRAHFRQGRNPREQRRSFGDWKSQSGIHEAQIIERPGSLPLARKNPTPEERSAEPTNMIM